MSDLADLQTRFLGFLTDRGGDIRDLVAEQGGVSADIRLEIYRKGYRLRLREAIDTDHEVLGSYLGDELFDRMVGDYIGRYPSQFFSLRDFTVNLPIFLRETAPFSEHPILAEIADFERLLLDVFDARDMPRANFGRLRDLTVEQWPDLRLRFHPSMQMFNTQWNSVECWRALKDGQHPPDAGPKAQKSHWLLWRGRDRLSQFRPLVPSERAMLLAALHGRSFSELCEQMTEWMPEGQVSTHMFNLLQGWLHQGLVVHLEA